MRTDVCSGVIVVVVVVVQSALRNSYTVLYVPLRCEQVSLQYRSEAVDVRRWVPKTVRTRDGERLTTVLAAMLLCHDQLTTVG